MQSHLGNGLTEVNKEGSESVQYVCVTLEKSSDVASGAAEDDNDLSFGSARNQLVVYNHSGSSTSQDAHASPELNEYYNPTLQSSSFPNFPGRVLPSVGAFTVQCAACFKWRLIPTKEKYEKIRETILQEPFVCELAREWRPDITCDDPADISPDSSKLWAIDKPNIAQPPPGWERLLRIRGEGSTRFADIYYISPSGKRLRSMVEIERYLLEHPEYTRDGVNLSQFSFLIPKPLQEDYVRKRPRLPNPNDSALRLPKPLEPHEEPGSSIFSFRSSLATKVSCTLFDAVNPLAWAGSPRSRDLHVGAQGLSSSGNENAENSLRTELPPHIQTKKATKSSSKRAMSSSPSLGDRQIGGPGFLTSFNEYLSHPPQTDPQNEPQRSKRKKKVFEPFSEGAFDRQPSNCNLRIDDPGNSEHADDRHAVDRKKKKKLVKQSSTKQAFDHPTGSPATKNKKKTVKPLPELVNQDSECNGPRIKIIGPHRSPFSNL